MLGLRVYDKMSQTVLSLITLSIHYEILKSRFLLSAGSIYAWSKYLGHRFSNEFDLHLVRDQSGVSAFLQK